MWFIVSSGWAESIPMIKAVPIQQLPHGCTNRLYPVVLSNGVLGCNRQGEPSVWYDAVTGRVDALPEASWIAGDALYASGQSGGLWELETSSWTSPKRRLLQEISEGAARIHGEHVVWVTETAVHHLDLHNGQSISHPATPVIGQAPDWLPSIAAVVWIEWGEDPSVVLWHVSTGETQRQPTTLATQVIATEDDVYWIDSEGIQHWSLKVNETRLLQSGLIQDLWVGSGHVCWSQVLDEEVDVWCDGQRWRRSGNQFHPRIQPWGRTFVEEGQLMRVLE